MNDFLQLACLTYTPDDGPTRIDKARQLLAADPSLTQANIYTAACVGNASAVSDCLNDDPEAVNRPGPLNWPPLVFACYSRLNLQDQSTLEVARLLLKHGADPNAHFMWGGQYRFTAVTGAFGEGESGPLQQPPHQEALALARLLLNAGADPNDSQALYNTMFTPGDDCLALLLEFGLPPDAKCNWLLGCPPMLRPNPQTTLHFQLMWAIRKYHTNRARMILKHGVDLTETDAEGTPWKAAVMAGHVELLDDLRAAGSVEEELTTVEQFVSAALSGDADEIDRLTKTDPTLTEVTIKTHPGLLHTAAGTGRLDAIRCLVEAGWELNPTQKTPLHEAAWNAQIEAAHLLLELGADPTIRDSAHNATPADWARHAGHANVAGLLGG